jgi:hypothetical protein
LNSKYCGFCKHEHSDMHANFSFSMNHDVIIILDLDEGNRSVTNDIEFVLWSIIENYETLFKRKGFNLTNFKIIYKDSLGIFDLVLLKENGEFDTFKSLNETDINAAIKRISDVAIPL